MQNTATLADGTDNGAEILEIEADTLLLTIEETAEHLRVKPWMVYQLCDKGEIPSIYLGPKTRRIKRDDLIAYINARPDTRPAFERDKSA